MSNVYFPDVSRDTSHVARYFIDTPAQTADVLAQQFRADQRFGVDMVSALGTYVNSQLFDKVTLTPEEYAESKYFREGVEVPKGGIKESVAESIANAYDRRFKRNLVLNRAKSGFGVTAGRFGAGILGSVMDPVAVGTALIAPVAIGLNATARAAAFKASSGIAQKYGTTAARVASGAGEAAVATALFEAAVAAPGTRILQDPEYDLYDSFINVAVGSVLGGVFTGVGGKFSDVLRRANPETVVKANEVAVSQLSEGLPVRIDGILDADPQSSPALRAEYAVKRSREEIASLVIKRPKSTELPPSLKAINNKVGNLQSYIRNMGGIKPGSVGSDDLKARLTSSNFRIMKKSGLTIDEMAVLAQDDGFFPSRVDSYNDRITVDEFVEAIEQNPISVLDEDAIARQQAEELYEEVTYLGINPKGMTDEELFEEMEIRQGAMTEEEAFQAEMSKGPGVTKEELDAEIQRTQELYESGAGLNDYENTSKEIDELTSSFEARMISNESKLKSVDDEIEVLERQVNALLANAFITEEELAALREWDVVIQQADSFDDVAEAGALCVLKGL